MMSTNGMHVAPRCGARTRRGSACQSPAVRGRKRCRMHGGADGSGAPKGNRNALKTGMHTREAIEMRRRFRQLMKDAKETLDQFE